MSAVQNRKKPTVKEQQPRSYVQVETGIYRYKDLDDEISYHERPWIIGRNGQPVRTYRALGFDFTKQQNLNNARTEYNRRRTEVAAGRNPYEAKKREAAPTKLTVEAVIRKYVENRYPNRYLKPRTGRTLEGEKSNCETILEYCGLDQPWHNKLWDAITPKSWDDYHTWRLAQINGDDEEGDEVKGDGIDLEPEEPRGDRAVDLERNTLNNAYKYALRKELITSNQVKDFPKFRPTTAVRHCREFKPENAKELHAIALLLFLSGREELAWQLLLEAYTGLRTSEVLMLRKDAKPGEPGYIDEQDNMFVRRLKGGINPFVHVHDGLKALLKAHAVWHALKHPNNPYFIPGKQAGQPMKRRALAHALWQLRSKIGRTIRSHGMRAFYVLIRRSWGIDDGVIAVELGQGSGAGLIATTYGDVPANWRNGGGPKLSWLPADPAKYAWAELEKKGWELPKQEQTKQEAVELAA